MTDAKPDALETLKLWRHDGPQHGPAQDAILDAAIAAWENERAERMLTVKGTSTMYMQLIERHDALRAAVEKVRDELRTISLNGDPGGGPGCSLDFLHNWADALDAALKGKP